MNPGSPAVRSLRVLAVPSEHGGWGFLLEPVVAGLLVAPSASGVALAAAALGGFLARHPLRLAAADILRARRTPRTRAAALIAGVYGALAALALGVAASRASDLAWLAPLLAASAPLSAQFVFDARNRGRELAPQLLGAAAPGGLATAIALAAGAALPLALALWLLLALRGVASVLYVRTRLRRDRGQPVDLRPALVSQRLALAAAVGAAAAGLGGWLAAAAFAGLLARASVGLRSGRSLRPQILGLSELALGLGTATLIGLGY